MVSNTKTLIHATFVQVLHAAMPPGQVPYALAGAVVGLATASGLSQPLHSMDAVCGRPDAAPLACHGLGIVRAVDVEQGLLYLLTQLAESSMQLVDVLQVRDRGLCAPASRLCCIAVGWVVAMKASTLRSDQRAAQAIGKIAVRANQIDGYTGTSLCRGEGPAWDMVSTRPHESERWLCSQVGRLELPPALLQAPGLQSPYLSLFSLTADGSGARIMKSRGNLQRQGQQAAN